MSNEESDQQRFERMGADHVRILVNNAGLPSHLLGPAAAWLAKCDAEDRLRKDASQIEQNQTALSAKKAAWIAAIAAIVAAAVAIIAAVIACLTWLWPRAP